MVVEVAALAMPRRTIVALTSYGEKSLPKTAAVPARQHVEVPNGPVGFIKHGRAESSLLHGGGVSAATEGVLVPAREPLVGFVHWIAQRNYVRS